MLKSNLLMFLLVFSSFFPSKHLKGMEGEKESFSKQVITLGRISNESKDDFTVQTAGQEDQAELVIGEGKALSLYRELVPWSATDGKHTGKVIMKNVRTGETYFIEGETQLVSCPCCCGVEFHGTVSFWGKSWLAQKKAAEVIKDYNNHEKREIYVRGYLDPEAQHVINVVLRGHDLKRTSLECFLDRRSKD